MNQPTFTPSLISIYLQTFNNSRLKFRHANLCILMYTVVNGYKEGDPMSTKKPKSFRFHEDDLYKLKMVHKYYKNKYETQVKNSNMNNLYKWSEAQTLAVLIRDRYQELRKNGELEKIVLKDDE
jgi:hypothetical protein